MDTDALWVLGTALITWLLTELSGGREDRRQRNVLNWLAIAERLGNGPESAAAHKVAQEATRELVTARTTTRRLVATSLAVASTSLVTLVLLALGRTGEVTGWTAAFVWAMFGMYGLGTVGLGLDVRQIVRARKAGVVQPTSGLLVARR